MDVRRYWDIPLGRPSPVRDSDEAVEAIREKLADAVRTHLVGDVPLGSFLSGGIDSTTVTALAAHQSSDRIRTFSIGFDVEEFSETS